jgi:hypothetical protein
VKYELQFSRFLSGAFSMKQPTVVLATLATGLILFFVLMNLAVSSQERDLCRNSFLMNDPCNGEVCQASPSPTRAPADQPTPTLAPPRSEMLAPASPFSQDLVKGQPVFLKIETDQNEIEVRLESP